MKIIVAKNIGFCSGVKRAIQIAERSLEQDQEPVQFLGTIVHNEQVIEKFRKSGVRFLKDLKEALPGTIVVQAHGIPPIKGTNQSISFRDATCPLVKKTQLLAKELQAEGFQVVIIGDKKHSETKGIKGYARKAKIIQNEKQARSLGRFKKIGVISQTTQNLKTVNDILRILKTKTKNLEFYNTLCSEVLNRQKEMREMSKKADAMLVIGSKTSANTKRLVEIAKKAKKVVWLINTYKELNKKNLSNVKTLGIISGASAPNWEIEKIMKCLQK